MATPSSSLPIPLMLQSQGQAGTSQLHLSAHTCSSSAHNPPAHTPSAQNPPAHSSPAHNSTERTNSSSISHPNLSTSDLPQSDYPASLRFSCFNSRGLISSWHYVQHILSHYSLDFLAISEHWLHQYNLSVIHQLSNDYKFIAVAAPEEEDTVFCVPRLIRGHGGVALGWRSESDGFVSPITSIATSRIIGIKFSVSQYTLYIISVYLPSRSGCTDVFKESLDQLEAMLMLLPSGAEVVIMGDFNADLGHLGGPRSCTQINEQGKILYRYISKWNFISTHLHLQTTASSITYESDAHSTLSTLDHILCPSFMLPKFISAYVIMEPLNISDHYPVFAALHCDYPSFTPPPPFYKCLLC